MAKRAAKDKYKNKQLPASHPTLDVICALGLAELHFRFGWCRIAQLRLFRAVKWAYKVVHLVWPELLPEIDPLVWWLVGKIPVPVVTKISVRWKKKKK